MMNKKLISLRLSLRLIKRLDDIRPYTKFHTRTEFIETACYAYAAFLADSLEEGLCIMEDNLKS